MRFELVSNGAKIGQGQFLSHCHYNRRGRRFALVPLVVRKRVHNADELMSEIVAERLVEHLERAGFVVMKKPPIGGSTPPYRG